MHYPSFTEVRSKRIQQSGGIRKNVSPNGTTFSIPNRLYESFYTLYLKGDGGSSTFFNTSELKMPLDTVISPWDDTSDDEELKASMQPVSIDDGDIKFNVSGKFLVRYHLTVGFKEVSLNGQVPQITVESYVKCNTTILDESVCNSNLHILTNLSNLNYNNTFPLSAEVDFPSLLTVDVADVTSTAPVVGGIGFSQHPGIETLTPTYYSWVDDVYSTSMIDVLTPGSTLSVLDGDSLDGAVVNFDTTFSKVAEYANTLSSKTTLHGETMIQVISLSGGNSINPLSYGGWGVADISTDTLKIMAKANYSWDATANITESETPELEMLGLSVVIQRIP